MACNIHTCSGSKGAAGSHAASHGFELLSSTPLVFVWHNFASSQECDHLIAAGKRLQVAIEDDPELKGALSRFGVVHGVRGFRRASLLPESRKLRAEFDAEAESELGAGSGLLRRFESAVSDFVGSPAHTDEDSGVLNITPGRSDGHALESGLHVDTHNGGSQRFATAILYLEDLGHRLGGHTLFPLATGSPTSAVATGEALLHAGVESTLEPPATEPARAASEALEQRAADAAGAAREGHDVLPAGALAVRPQRGSLLLFFTRTREGKVDARSWHGSAAVAAGAQKWTVQTFKAAPQGKDPEAFGADSVAPHLFVARDALPPVAFKALRPVLGASHLPLGAQDLVEEEVVFGTQSRLRVISSHVIAGALRDGEGSADLTGLVLWPASLLLAAHVTTNSSFVAGRRVLDLGCGCGIAGIAAAAAGAREVVLLDASPWALALAERNVDVNGVTAARTVLRSMHDILDDLGSFDAVLAGDVLYAGSEWGTSCASGTGSPAERLARTLEAVLAPSGQALIATQQRSKAMADGLRTACTRLVADIIHGWSPVPNLALWHLRQQGDVPARHHPNSVLSELD